MCERESVCVGVWRERGGEREVLDKRFEERGGEEKGA